LAEEVMHNIYAVIKFLYSALFRWLQSTVNAAFKADDDVAVESYIGILDIFGFEIMESNSFEQLCINYANELLQKLFNETIFTTEQEAYAAEGIVWQQLDYQDNQAIIDLLSLKPNGLFPTIEAQGEQALYRHIETFFYLVLCALQVC
jgi:myosin heavy subunit